MSTDRFEYVRDELTKAKAYIDEAKALIDEYSAPASGMPHTPTQGCTCHPTDPSTWTTYGSAVEPGSMWEPDPDCPEHGAHTEIDDEPDLSQIPAELIVRDPEICSGRPTMRGTRILASRIAGELAAGTSWELLHEWYPSMPVPAAQAPALAPGTVQESTGEGTGEREAHGSSEAVELVPGVWISGTRQNGKITAAIAAAVEAARPVHYREAAASLRKLGHTAAAERLESYVRDLDEEAGR